MVFDGSGATHMVVGTNKISGFISFSVLVQRSAMIARSGAGAI